MKASPKRQGKWFSAFITLTLDIHQLIFANNVRLNLKATDFAEDQVAVSVNFGGGKLAETPEVQGISQLASAVFIAGGRSP